MKRLSDYKGEDAIELWADLLEPMTKIFGNKDVRNTIQSGKPKMLIAQSILKGNKKEATEILTRIDPAPLDGFNILVRLVGLLAEVGSNEELKSFFGYAEQAKMENEYSGSPTESTEDAEN